MKGKVKKTAFRTQENLQIINPDAAGIDVASTEFQVCVPADRCQENNRIFGAFTKDLHLIAQWLKMCRIKTVAMESTSVYWVQLFCILQEYGLEVILVNASHIKKIASAKTDKIDASWIQMLHSYGLLKASFQPDNLVRQLRNLNRHRESLIAQSSTYILLMQKSLELMNVKLHKVISDLAGKSGMAILKAIVEEGEHNPKNLSKLVDKGIKATPEEIVLSLEADWKQEQLFILKQNYKSYMFCREQIAELDKEIEGTLVPYTAQKGKTVEKKEAGKQKGQKNDLLFNAEYHIQRCFGVNITAIPGISQLSGLKLLSELGADFVTKFANDKKFGSWSNVAPCNKMSAGKLYSSKVPKKRNKVGQILRVAASTLKSSKSALGSYFRKIQSRKGFNQAVVATANKLATIIYHMVKTGTEYNEEYLLKNEQNYLQKKMKKLELQLQTCQDNLLANRQLANG
jgi:transposase